MFKFLSDLLCINMIVKLQSYVVLWGWIPKYNSEDLGAQR